jgi:hypothetical protein
MYNHKNGREVKQNKFFIFNEKTVNQYCRIIKKQINHIAEKQGFLDYTRYSLPWKSC